MKKKLEEELDLRTVSSQRAPLRCSVDGDLIYEVQFENLRRKGPSGSSRKLHVVKSSDRGKTWQPIRLKRNLRKHWWAIASASWGGGWWPPAGEDIRDAYIKDGKLCIAYSDAYEQGGRGQTYLWEAQYEPKIDRWNIELLKEEH